MINTNSCLHSLMALRFAMWELHLYLDTHPDDEDKLRLLNSYKEKYAAALPEYESKHGPLSPATGSGCTWIDTPFPWVKGGSC